MHYADGISQQMQMLDLKKLYASLQHSRLSCFLQQIAICHRSIQVAVKCSPSVVHVQKLHWNLRPPSINTMNGHMYALHLLHLTGPIWPRSTTGNANCKASHHVSGNSKNSTQLTSLISYYGRRFSEYKKFKKKTNKDRMSSDARSIARQLITF